MNLSRSRLFLAAAAALVLSAPAMAQEPVLEFGVTTSTSNGQSVIPQLTWQTTPAAQGCTASGADDWSGAKAASGAVTLEAITATRAYAITCTWAGDQSATLRWTAPTENTDGTPLTDLAGFRIEVGQAPDSFSQSLTLQDPSATQHNFDSLPVGTWYFGVRAFNASGLESERSNIASKTIVGGVEQSRTLEVVVRFPNAPGGLTVE